MNESALISMNPMSLLFGLIFIGLAAFYCAYLYRDTNDFKKSTLLYFPMIAVLDAVLLLGLNISALLCAGMDVFGFIILSLVSNYYFYH